MGKNKTIEVIGKEKLDGLEGYRLIAGYRGFGAVGVIAAQHIVKKLGVKEKAIILPDSDTYYIYREGKSILHPYELYMDHENKILILVAREMPSDSTRTFVRELSSMMSEIKIKPIYLIGGLDARFRTDDGTNLRWLANRYYIDRYGSIKEPPLEEGLMIIGPLAFHFAYAEKYKLPVIALLPYTRTNAPDPQAASYAIDALNRLVGMNIGTKELIEEAEVIERELERIEKTISKERGNIGREPYM